MKYIQSLACLLLGAAALLLANGCSLKTNCVMVEVKVVKVGGCTNWGKCGVLYSDGSSSIEYYPVEGQTVHKWVCK